MQMWAGEMAGEWNTAGAYTVAAGGRTHSRIRQLLPVPAPVLVQIEKEDLLVYVLIKYRKVSARARDWNSVILWNVHQVEIQTRDLCIQMQKS